MKTARVTVVNRITGTSTTLAFPLTQENLTRTIDGMLTGEMLDGAVVYINEPGVWEPFNGVSADVVLENMRYEKQVADRARSRS